jgi:Zn-finger nucleic acid-binding protein
MSKVFGKYPANLPRIPIYNDLDTCVNCGHVWLDLDGAPDFNHCTEMSDPANYFSTLTKEQQEEYMRVRDSVQCPFYHRVSEKGPPVVQ